MVKLNAPVMSLDASGSLGGAITYSKWKGRNYARTLVTPANPRSALQTSMRAMFKFLSQQWAGLSSADKATWSDLAEAGVYSNFNAFMSVNQERWRNFLSPSKAYPVAAAGTVGTLDDWTATAGVRQITLTWDVSTENDNWGAIIYRDLTTSFTPGISNVLAVQANNGILNNAYVDTPLEPDEYFYRIELFTDDGISVLQAGEVNATVA